MNKKLLGDALKKLIAGVAAIWLLLFLPAGTLRYCNAWVFSAVLFIPVILMGIVLYFKAPDLLRKRLQEKESQTEQKAVVGASAVMFLLGFVLCGLDYRFGWSNISKWTVYAASAVFLVGYGLFAEVMRENAYLSRTVEVQEEQTVIDSGLYGIVRHPMYFATLLMFYAMPVILGSWIGAAVFLIYIPVIVVRIKNEEALLKEGLDGYSEYQNKVRYRLIPFVW